MEHLTQKYAYPFQRPKVSEQLYMPGLLIKLTLSSEAV